MCLSVETNILKFFQQWGYPHCWKPNSSSLIYTILLILPNQNFDIYLQVFA